MTKKCLDQVTPHVNEEAIECGCGITKTNCVMTSEADSFLKVLKGETLTSVYHKISDLIKKAFSKINKIAPEYVAVLNQIGTNAPTIGLTSNATGGTISTTYVGVGDYNIVATQPLFVPGTTFAIAPSPTPLVYTTEITVVSTTVVNIKTRDAGGVLADDLLVDNPVMIKIPV